MDWGWNWESDEGRGGGRVGGMDEETDAAEAFVVRGLEVLFV